MRIENSDKDATTPIIMDMTRAVYPHDQVYGQYCPINAYIAAPPREVYEYLADTRSLEEWTYSLRGFTETEEPGLWVVLRPARGPDQDLHPHGCQSRRDDGGLPLRVGPGRAPVDDLPDARGRRSGGAEQAGIGGDLDQLQAPVLRREPLSRRPLPPDRPVWVGDFWDMFYAGHQLEMDNLKAICEYRAGHGLPIKPEWMK